MRLTNRRTARLVSVASLLFAALYPTLPPDAWANGPFRFTNVTASARFLSLRNSGGHGVQWADVNADGWPDIYVTHIFAPNEDRPDLLFINQGDGTFRELGEALGVSDDGFFGRLSEESHAALFADFDNDGDYDLFNGHTWSGNHRMYRNDGGGRFEDVSGPDGIEPDDREPRGIAGGDVDGDGNLDLVVSSWEHVPMQLYLGSGNLRFRAATQLGRRATRLAQQGIMLTDYDGDFDLDLALTGHIPIQDPTGAIALYRNDGHGGFTDVTDSLGIRFGDEGINGVSFGDLDNDADLDLVVVGKHRSQVYLNDGRGSFRLSQALPRGNYTAALADFDHDGDLDVYIGGSEAIFANHGDGRFELHQSVGIVGVGNDGRGTAVADFDGDGDLDIALASKRGPNTLFRNDQNDSNWLRVRLVSPSGNAGGFGAKVYVYDARHVDDPAHLRGFREARGATGYCSQDEPELHFGVPAGRAYEIKAVFPNGIFYIAKGIEAPARIVIDPRQPPTP
jgi:hypothetical protein